MYGGVVRGLCISHKVPAGDHQHTDQRERERYSVPLNVIDSTDLPTARSFATSSGLHGI
jgi:hypothetical protein